MSKETKPGEPRWSRISGKINEYGARYGPARLRIVYQGAGDVHQLLAGGRTGPLVKRDVEQWEASASIWLGGDIAPIEALERAHYTIDSREEAEKAAKAAARRLAKWIRKTAVRLIAGGLA